MFNYEIKLNNMPLSNVAIGFSTVEKLEEALDESGFYLPITTQDIEYQMFGVLSIKATDVLGLDRVFSLLIINDTLEPSSFDGYYKHNLRVLEYSIKLDKYLLNAFAFTKPLVSERRARFKTYLLDGDILAYITAPIIKEAYEINKEYTFKKVSQTYLLTGTASARAPRIKTDTYIKFPSDATYYNISEADVTYQFATDGEYEIDICYEDIGDVMQVGLKYYINVLDTSSNTLFDIIDNIRSICPLESKKYFDTTRLFDFTDRLESILKSTKAPQMFFQRLTVRQALNIVFKYINSISRLIYVSKTSDTDFDLLDFDEFNKIDGAFDNKEIIGMTSSQDVRDYGSVGVGWLENVLPSNDLKSANIQTPNRNQFKTVRSTNIQLTQSDFSIPLEMTIHDVKKITVLIPKVDIFGAIDGTAYQRTLSNFELDLTSRLLNKTEWDIKNVTNNFPTMTLIDVFRENVGMRLNKVGNFYFEQGTREIKISEVFGELFQSNLIINVINEGLTEWLTVNSAQTIYFNNEVLLGTIISNTDYRNLSFNIEYITIEDTTIQVDRADISEMPYYSELRMNQDQRLLNINLTAKNMYGDIQRSGTPSKNFSQIYKSFEGIYNIGSRDIYNYVIVERDIRHYNEHIVANYRIVKNHNRLAEFIGVGQEYRVFEIPSGTKSYDRHDRYVDYLVITRPDDTTLVGDDVKFVNEFINDFVFSITNRTTPERLKMTYALVRTDGFLEIEEFADLYDGKYYAIQAPVSSNGYKGGLVFTFGFNHNQLAGNALWRDSGGRIYNKGIRYTDLYGRLNEMWFGIGGFLETASYVETIPSSPANLNFNKGSQYPLYITTNADISVNLLVKCGSPMLENVNNDSIIVKKDSSSKYSISYIVNVVPLNADEYVYGEDLFKYNLLVYDYPRIDGTTTVDITRLSLYKYDKGSSVVYDYLGDDTIIEGYSQVLDLVGSRINHNTSTNVVTFTGDAIMDLNVHKVWAIGDTQGRLYLACNKGFNGFKLVARHIRPNIKKIGSI